MNLLQSPLPQSAARVDARPGGVKRVDGLCGDWAECPNRAALLLMSFSSPFGGFPVNEGRRRNFFDQFALQPV